jgi:hypothetical protein
MHGEGETCGKGATRQGRRMTKARAGGDVNEKEEAVSNEREKEKKK